MYRCLLHRPPRKARTTTVMMSGQTNTRIGTVVMTTAPKLNTVMKKETIAKTAIYPPQLTPLMSLPKHAVYDATRLTEADK